MDEPYSTFTRDGTTWQSEAEKQTEPRGPVWRRPLGIALGAAAVAAIIVARTLYWMSAQLQAARAQVEAGQTQLQESDANVAAAELQLSYCTIAAPVTGTIGHRTVSVGNYVNPGQALFAIVQDNVWVTANFKEMQLAAMRPGQPVDLAIAEIEPGRRPKRPAGAVTTVSP